MASDPGLTALNLAGCKSTSYGANPAPMAVYCKTCGDIKRLHGVWRFGLWQCPHCVRQLELTQ